MVAGGGQRAGGPLRCAGQPGRLRQRQPLPGLDTTADGGEFDDDDELIGTKTNCW